VKEIAIIAIFWEQHAPILMHYLKNLPDSYQRTLYLLYPMEAKLIEAIEELGHVVVPMDRNVLSEQAHRAAKKSTFQMLSKLRSELATPAWDSFCQTQGIPTSTTTDAISRTLSAKLDVVTTIVKLLDNIHQTHFIELILVSEDVSHATRAAIAWGRREQVPSLHAQHGPVLGLSFSVHLDLFADHMAVYGAQAANAFGHIEQDRIHLTGNPAWAIYAQLAQHKAATRTEIMQRFKLDTQQPLIVFAATKNSKNPISAGYGTQEHEHTLRAIFLAKKRLDAQGTPIQLIIKNRVSNFVDEQNHDTCQRIANDCGLSREDYIYTTTDMEQLTTAADIFVSSESSTNIEAMLVETPSISLNTQFGLARGGVFHAEDGIIDICHYDAHSLAAQIDQLLNNANYRKQHIEKMRAHRQRFHSTAEQAEDQALKNTTQLLTRLAKQPPEGLSFKALKKTYLWETLDSYDDNPLMGLYHTRPRSELIQMFEFTPTRYLEIGCAAGGTIKEVKRQFPDCITIGVELNKHAAKLAAEHSDIIIDQPIEAVNLESFGIEKGSIDSVILADVLEHMYNPWGALKAIHPYLSDHAQVLASIPNLKNLWLINEIINNRWTYQQEGLLDITHIRFFTWPEIVKLFQETGYRVTKKGRTYDARLQGGLPKNRTLDFGKMLIRDISEEEFEDLKTVQFLSLAHPVST